MNARYRFIRHAFGLAAVSGLASLLLVGVYAIGEESAAPSQSPELKDLRPSFEVRRAEAALKLATFDLQRALHANREMPHTVLKQDLERLRQFVAAAEERLARAKAAWNSAPNHAALEAAGGERNRAELEYRKALRANRLTPDAVGPLELQRLELAAEVARFDLCRQRAESSVRSVLGELAWEVSVLREEVSELRTRIAELSR